MKMEDDNAAGKRAGRVLLPDHVVPKRYDIHLTPNLKDFTFAGVCDITFQVADSVDSSVSKSIILHAKELCFATASFTEIGTSRKTVEAEEMLVKLKETTVQFNFSEPLTAGTTIKLNITYTGFLNNQMAGFYRSNYTDINGESKVMASTQFESLDARRCFPCVDEPAAKAVFGVTLSVESYLDVLSNMPISNSQRLSATQKQVSFQDTPKMSTYLLAICVGEFDCVQTVTEHGVSVAVYTPPGKSEAGRFALDAASRCLDAYDDFFGTHFPLPKLDMIAIPEFAMGAMENWGLVTYREVDLLIDPITASSSQKQRVVTVVTHELAHQWFGNLVTMQWWDDLWLNEGFASWAENWASDKLYPDYCMWDQFTTGALASALRLDAMKSSHPIQVPIQHAEEVEQVFDAISYCKGGSVVRMIKAVLGFKNFQTGLSNYMKKHAYGNTETVDLWSAWEEVSGIPVKELMSSWTEQMGFPLVRVVEENWKSDEVSMKLEQTWFLADGSELDQEGAAKKWAIPILSCSNTGPHTDMTLMREKSASFSMKLSGDMAWVKLNAGQEVPMRVLNSVEMLRRLAPSIQDKTLGVIDRAALVNDAYALVKAGQQSPESLINLLGNYKNEDSYVVWEGLSSCLLGLNAVLSDSEKLSGMFKAFARKLSLRLMEEVGWDSQTSDEHLTTLLRGLMIGLVSTFAYDDDVVKKEAATRFAAFLSDPNDVGTLPGDMRVPVFKIVLKNGGAAEYEAVKAYFFSAKTNADRTQVLKSIGHTQDPKLKLSTMEWSTSGEIKLQDFFYAMGSVGGSGGVGKEISWTYFQENIEHIKGMIGKASSSLMDAVIVMCASGFCSTAKADEIEAFFKSHPLPMNTRKISQVLENMRSSAKFRGILEESKLSSEEFWSAL